MSIRKISLSRFRIKAPHRFDNGFIPTANSSRDSIIVTRNSPLISSVQRKRPGEYWIQRGSFIGGGGSRPATAEEAADYMSQSPPWAVDETHEGARMGVCASLFGTDKIWVCSDEITDAAKLEAGSRQPGPLQFQAVLTRANSRTSLWHRTSRNVGHQSQPGMLSRSERQLHCRPGHLCRSARDSRADLRRRELRDPSRPREPRRMDQPLRRRRRSPRSLYRTPCHPAACSRRRQPEHAENPRISGLLDRRCGIRPGRARNRLGQGGVTMGELIVDEPTARALLCPDPDQPSENGERRPRKSKQGHKRNLKFCRR